MAFLCLIFEFSIEERDKNMAFTLLEKQTGIYRGYEPCADGSAVLESGMNNYWQQRSSSYSDQNMAQLFSEKRAAWENLIFYHGNEKKNSKYCTLRCAIVIYLLLFFVLQFFILSSEGVYTSDVLKIY